MTNNEYRQQITSWYQSKITLLESLIYKHIEHLEGVYLVECKHTLHDPTYYIVDRGGKNIVRWTHKQDTVWKDGKTLMYFKYEAYSYLDNDYLYIEEGL